MLRQGKLDGAIQAYVRLVEDRPSDWKSINALGDVCLRAGDAERAIAQFTKAADQFFSDGSLQKSAALYKKALKANADHEPTLERLGEIAVQQGLLADAERYLNRLADQRRHRGDETGAAELLVQLETLKEAKAERIAATMAKPDVEDTDEAIFISEPDVEDADGIRVISMAKPGGDDTDGVRVISMAKPDVDDTDRDEALSSSGADAFEREERLTEEVNLLLSRAQEELASPDAQHAEAARATLTRVLATGPGRRGEVMSIAVELALGEHRESALWCVGAVVDGALRDGERERAVDWLQTFTRTAPYVPALVRLVEICVEAGLDAPRRVAQAQLADAYLAEGRGLEARVIAEDLLDHDPGSHDHARQLYRVLTFLGVPNAVDLVNERFREPANAVPPDTVDLTDALADLASSSEEAGATPSSDENPSGPAPVLRP